jgi:hypothetical protein
MNGPGGIAVIVLICLSAVGYFGIVSVAGELFERLDRLHSNGRLPGAPYRLLRWGRVQLLGAVYVFGLSAKDIASGETRRLIGLARNFILLHLVGALAALAVFFVFVVYPEIARAS